MRNLAFLLGLSLTALSGCGWMQGPAFRQPSLYYPGTASQKQQTAVAYDPYLSNDLAPEIVGARPYGYRSPPNNASHGRQNPPWGNWRGQPQY